MSQASFFLCERAFFFVCEWDRLRERVGFSQLWQNISSGSCVSWLYAGKQFTCAHVWQRVHSNMSAAEESYQ